MGNKSSDTSDTLQSSDDFEAVYKSHAPSIQRFLYWRTHNTELSKDLTSNVFEKAWRSRSSFENGSAKAWLYRIARNVLIDHWRKKKDVLVDDIDSVYDEISGQSIEETLDKALLAEQLMLAVNKLPDAMREVVQLRFIEGMSCKLVANHLHLSESNVRVLQYRALRKLRSYLQ